MQKLLKDKVTLKRALKGSLEKLRPSEQVLQDFSLFLLPES